MSKTQHETLTKSGSGGDRSHKRTLVYRWPVGLWSTLTLVRMVSPAWRYWKPISEPRRKGSNPLRACGGMRRAMNTEGAISGTACRMVWLRSSRPARWPKALTSRRGLVRTSSDLGPTTLLVFDTSGPMTVLARPAWPQDGSSIEFYVTLVDGEPVLLTLPALVKLRQEGNQEPEPPD